MKKKPFSANLRDWGSITFKGVSAAASKNEAERLDEETQYYLQVPDITNIDLLQEKIGKVDNPYYVLERASREGHLVHFAWSSMDYVGMLNSFSSTFTYFARSGAPLRAVTDISIDVELDKNAATAQEIANYEEARGDAKANTKIEEQQLDIDDDDEDHATISIQPMNKLI